MLERLIQLVSRLGHWAYLAIFLGALLESAAFLGVFVPGEALVMFGGFLAAQDVLDLWDLIPLVCLGAILGDSIGYELGRLLGRVWLLRYGRFLGLRPEYLRRVEDFFARHGGKAVLLGRFSAFLRALVPFVAGTSKMHYPRFLLYNAVGGIVWSTGCLLIGYIAGESWEIAGRWVGRAGAIVTGLFLTLIVFALLWRWAVRHEATLKRWWAALMSRPAVAALRRRLSPLASFLHARLTPGEYLGLSLTVGLLVLVGAAWGFVTLAQDVLGGERITQIDHRVADWFGAHAAEPLTTVVKVITYCGAPSILLAVSALIAVLLVRRRSWYRLLELVLVVPGGMLLNEGLKQLFQRLRPDLDRALIQVPGYSFPSGHTSGALLFYGLLAVFAVQSARTWRGRVSIATVAVLAVVLIGFSRVYLAAHYVSDVLAGAALALAWLALCLTAVETYRRSRTVA